MTLPTGTISMSQVNTELGRSATAVISMNETDVRNLAGKPSGAISMSDLQGKNAGGQAQFTGAGTWSWTCPAGVYSVCVVCVGGGHSGGAFGGGGGGLGWKNNIAVVPGTTYTVRVGGAADQTGSYFISATTVCGKGANGPNGGGWVGDGGGNGGYGGPSADISGWLGGGGGAGGYTGYGGDGGDATGDPAGYAGYDGTGGGGGGGGAGSMPGGGVGIHGQGVNGEGAADYQTVGGPGSGGVGTRYGGGGVQYAGAGGGAVRIIWGSGRAFPSTKTYDV